MSFPQFDEKKQNILDRKQDSWNSFKAVSFSDKLLFLSSNDALHDAVWAPRVITFFPSFSHFKAL